MEIKFTLSEGKVDVFLLGELDTPATVEIQSEVEKLLEYSEREMTIDCKDLSYIASSGLRLLITLHKSCNAAGGHLCLVNVRPDVMEIFSVTNFDKVFDIR